jgi:hypothetical protein
LLIFKDLGLGKELSAALFANATSNTSSQFPSGAGNQTDCISPIPYAAFDSRWTIFLIPDFLKRIHFFSSHYVSNINSYWK